MPEAPEATTPPENAPQASEPPHDAKSVDTRWTKTNWLLMALGVATLAIGFVILAMVDARAQNFAAHLAPITILGGYALIFVSIVYRDSDG